MQILIDTDDKNRYEWRWIILDDNNQPLAGSPEGTTMSWIEAFDKARQKFESLARFQLSRFSFEPHTPASVADIAKKFAPKVEKALDLGNPEA